MPETLGYHLTKTTYGTWLPGDRRGSWLKEWSPKEGYGPVRRLADADPSREAMARRQMNHDACMLTEEMIDAVVDSISDCVIRSKGGLTIMAAAIEPTHVHLLLPNTGRDIDVMVKWLADQTTKAIHRRTTHSGPVWTSKPWCEYIDDDVHWEQLLQYIDEHNIRAGRGSRPYPFLCEIEV